MGYVDYEFALGVRLGADPVANVKASGNGLQRTNIGPGKKLARIVAHIRRYWPHVQIVVRGDTGFCREHLMRWCEANGVDYLFGLAKNGRLLRILGKELRYSMELFAGCFRAPFREELYPRVEANGKALGTPTLQLEVHDQKSAPAVAGE